MTLDLMNKSDLYSFLEGGCAVDNADEAAEICYGLLTNLGSPDAELRDGLSFTILAKLLLDKGALRDDQMRQLLDVVLDDKHLFYCIGESGTDSVFMRSFSVLVVSAILERDRRDGLFMPSAAQTAIDAVLRYAMEEQDRRGYIENKGWAHSVAHNADALDSCIQHTHVTIEQRDLALDVLRSLIMSEDYLVHDEDGRLAETVYHMIAFERVDKEILQDWLAGFAQRTYGTSLQPSSEGWNAQNFLRRLYLRLHWAGDVEHFVSIVEEILKQVDPLAAAHD